MNLIKIITFLFITLTLAYFPLEAKKPGSTASVRKQVWDLVYKEKYELAKNTVEAELKNKPDNLKLLSLLEISLNGLNRSLEANRVRGKILSIWKSKYEKKYIEDEYPLNLSSWIRMVEVKPGALITAAEYYIPYPVNREHDGYYYHKFTVYNRITKQTEKFYKLEKSKFSKGQYILYLIDASGKAEEIRNYGEDIPDIQDEMDLILKKTN